MRLVCRSVDGRVALPSATVPSGIEDQFCLALWTWGLAFRRPVMQTWSSRTSYHSGGMGAGRKSLSFLQIYANPDGGRAETAMEGRYQPIRNQKHRIEDRELP